MGKGERGVEEGKLRGGVTNIAEPLVLTQRVVGRCLPRIGPRGASRLPLMYQFRCYSKSSTRFVVAFEIHPYLGNLSRRVASIKLGQF